MGVRSKWEDSWSDSRSTHNKYKYSDWDCLPGAAGDLGTILEPEAASSQSSVPSVAEQLLNF